MDKHSYRRRPGRPPKPKDDNGGSGQQKKGRGRLPKVGRVVHIKKRRGRPPKNDTTMRKSVEENPDQVINLRVAANDKIKSNNTTSSSSVLSYKSLYITAEKKIEVLLKEKFALLQELQLARGQIVAYEKMMNVVTTTTSKKAIVFRGLTNAATSSAPSAQGRLQDRNRIGQSTADDKDENASPKDKNISRRKWRRN